MKKFWSIIPTGKLGSKLLTKKSVAIQKLVHATRFKSSGS